MRGKKALIVKFGQIGDVIMAIPAVRLLHEQGFEIHWACGKAVQPVLACYSWIHVIPVDDKSILFGGLSTRAAGIFALWRLILVKKYDFCATLYYDKRYRLLTFPVRASRKLMLSLHSRALTLLPGRHHTDEYVRILLGEPDSCREKSTGPVLPDRLPPSPLPEKSTVRRIAIVPGGVNNLVREQSTGLLPERLLRCWPVECYVVLARALLQRGWEVILLGGPEDAWTRSYFKHMTVTDCLGTLSLPQVISVCDASDAVITHDTGPLHLAGLSTTCLVGIFGPTDPATRVPRRPHAVGVWGGRGFACRPCYDGRDFAPCIFNGCMHQVTPDLVLHALDAELEIQARGAASVWKIVVPDLQV